jgi:hypothetical protein
MTHRGGHVRSCSRTVRTLAHSGRPDFMNEEPRLVFHPTCRSCHGGVQVTLADWRPADRGAPQLHWSCPRCAFPNTLPVLGRLLDVQTIPDLPRASYFSGRKMNT